MCGRRVGLSLACGPASPYHSCIGARTSDPIPGVAVHQASGYRRPHTGSTADHAFRAAARKRYTWLVSRNATQSEFRRRARLGSGYEPHREQDQAGTIRLEDPEVPDCAAPPITPGADTTPDSRAPGHSSHARLSSTRLAPFDALASFDALSSYDPLFSSRRFGSHPATGDSARGTTRVGTR